MLCYTLRYAILCYDIVHTDWTCSCRIVYEFLKRINYNKPMLKQTQSTSYCIGIIVLKT